MNVEKKLKVVQVLDTTLLLASMVSGTIAWNVLRGSEMKTISQQIEDIATDFCRNYCKWPDQFDEEAEGCELSESEHCSNCPLNKL